jgi:hypothetical protein
MLGKKDLVVEPLVYVKLLYCYKFRLLWIAIIMLYKHYRQKVPLAIFTLPDDDDDDNDEFEGPQSHAALHIPQDNVTQNKICI